MFINGIIYSTLFNAASKQTDVYPGSLLGNIAIKDSNMK